jgi:hypothetical protein
MDYNNLNDNTNNNTNTNSINLGSWTDLLSNQFRGINAIIVANMCLAFSQPFISNNILPVSNFYIAKKFQSIFIGATSMFSSLGYAIGYLISIYAIKSSEEYFDRFQDINICYLLIMVVLVIFYILFTYTTKSWKVPSPSLSDQNIMMNQLRNLKGGDDLKEEEIKDVVQIIIKNSLPEHESQSQNKQKEERKIEGVRIHLKKYRIHIVLTLTYAIIYSIFNLTSNYLELILLWKNFDSDVIFIASFLNLVPGIPFPIIFGYLMNTNIRKCKNLATGILSFQIISSTLFLYLNNEIAIYIILFILGATGSSLPSIFLTLISYANQDIYCGETNNNDNVDNKIKDKNKNTQLDIQKSETENDYWNNIILSSSTLLTVLFLLIPLSNSNSQILYIIATILQITTFLIFYFL